MSGFATIVNFDGKPVDRQLLAKMADHLTFRGPDEQRIWVGGWNQNVGMVHAKFATTYEAERESQPLTVDGNTWVTGHIRLDAREELWEKLEGKGRQGVRQATDAALLLRAYETWGERCLEHLLGDFGFAVWDERARKLWCATDHMGVRPVFHEQHQQTVVASNTLDCVRLHPDSRDELNELAAADFLVHDFNTDATSTAYAAIGRLEPGSSLSFKDGHATSHIYWDLPIEDPVLGRSDREWCEEFRELAGRAVADRIRTKKIALYMSGGIDSTTLAAITASRLPRSHENLICYCYGFQRLIKDDELHYAALVADKLGLQIRFRYRDNACFDPDWHEKSTRTPEPTTAACSFEAEGALFAEVAGSSRVGFYGEGPDNALKYEFASYLRYLVRSREVATLVQSVFDHLRVHKQLPATRAGLRWLSARTARNREPNPSPDAVLPKWLSRELVARLGLMERYRRVYDHGERGAHTVRPGAYWSMRSNLWRRLFDAFDPALYRVPFEMRHPFLDVRLLQFFLRIPVIPWCRKKAILRQAMEGQLPEEVISRSKVPLRADPVHEAAKAGGYRYPALRATDVLAGFLEPGLLPVGNVNQTAAYYEDFRLFALDQWLGGLRSGGRVH